MPMTILILRLEGVLQSWGERSRWDFRDTNTMPTKSGVIGLISCAMGLSRGDKKIIELFDGLKMGVRADRNGMLLEDFHTVTGERKYLYNSEGKKRVGSPTILTPCQYIQDACFTLALSGDIIILEQIKDALLHPVWQTYLGRKSCVPSRPVYEAITNNYDSIAEAISKYPLCSRPNPVQGDYYLCEYDDKNGESLRRDVIKNNHLRNFGYRRIKNMVLSGKGMR